MRIQARAPGVLKGGIALAASLILCARSAQAGPEAPLPPGVEFLLGEGAGAPGDLVDIELSIRTVEPLQGASFAIDFDERQLRIEDVHRVVTPASPALDNESRAEGLDNRDDADGNQNVEGWVHIELTSSDPSRALEIPVGEETLLFILKFRILDNAVEGFSPVEFKDLGPMRIGTQTVILTNAAQRANGGVAPADFAMVVPPENLDQGGIVIQIIGEVGFFLRGDSNMDFTRDVADPVKTLIYLFQGETFLPCEDASDANDDGKIDLSDSVFTLNRLFTGGNPFPDPDQRKGPDPTADRLGCETD